MVGRKSLSILAIVSAAALAAVGLLASPEPSSMQSDAALPQEAPQRGVVGPDVTVYHLPNVTHFGESGGIHSYAVGTTSCNIGDEPLWWCDENRAYCNDEQHPVIAQNLYRLKDGRFEQLGMSWLKHGFLALAISAPECGNGTCVSPPHGGDQLGVGCTDPYSSGLNGARHLGMRSEVVSTTGLLDPFPFTEVPFSGPLDQRLLVKEADLDPLLNPGARYWVEGHYIAADDAEARNAHNNASYREVTVQAPSYNLSLTGNTIRQQPAIYAWQAVDPRVEVLPVDASSSERFHAARRVTVTPGNAHFEYAIHNLNSDRAAGRFTVELPAGSTITNAGFRDVDHHSGEPYADTDWTVDVKGNTVTWFTEDFANDPQANALRWGTLFSFWFDADAGTDDVVETLGMFRPGSPNEIEIPFSNGALFADGFETGDAIAWSCVGPPACK